MAQIVKIPPHRRHGAVYRTKQYHGPLTRYPKLRIAHAPRMPGTFSPPSRVSNPDMHHGKCVTHVPWCMSGSLISGFLWSQSRGKRSRHSRRMRNPQVCVSGKRPMALLTWRHKSQWNFALNAPVSASEGLRSYQKINRNMIYTLYSHTKNSRCRMSSSAKPLFESKMISLGLQDDLIKFSIVPDIDVEVFGILDGVLVEAPTHHLQLDLTRDALVILTQSNI